MVLTRRTDPRLIAGIERVIARHRGAGVDGGQVPLGPLRRYHTFAFYEARANGVVVAGSIDRGRGAADRTRRPAGVGGRAGAREPAHGAREAGRGRDVGRTRRWRSRTRRCAEAYLVAEKRYRPSYTERLAELEAHPPRPRRRGRRGDEGRAAQAPRLAPRAADGAPPPTRPPRAGHLSTAWAG
jgi:hypothetical protein